MEGGSEGESNKNAQHSPSDGQNKKPKRQMKTPFQLETLEKVYAMETYPSEAIRAELSEKLGLTDRQLQMWFCHRRLKDKKEAAGVAAMKPRVGPNGGASGKRSFAELTRDEVTIPEPVRYYESPRTAKERKIIACIESQLGEPLRSDGPILGVEFDELPPGAFGAPIVPTERRDHYRHSYDTKLFGGYEPKQYNALPSGLHEPAEPKIRSDGYDQIAPSYHYGSPARGPTKPLSVMKANGHFSREYTVESQASTINVLPQHGFQGQFQSPPRESEFTTPNEATLQMDHERKNDEARIGREALAHEKRIRKELEKQDLLRRKREEQMKKEMERLDRERKKEEQRLMREQQRKEERFQREEKREMERREKFLQRELLRAERKRQKEELRKEREAAKQKAAMERAAARKFAKEAMELIEDERLELMELAASNKGLSSIASLDYDTLQNLELYREFLCEFPPKSIEMKRPFSIQPWIDSQENIGNLLMAWRFCINFADVLGLWPFTLDEFVQAFHDYDSRLLSEIHIALLKLIIKDIEDVVRTPSGGPGTNQYNAVNPEGGHPQIVEGAYVWGFDICNWQKHLNPLTWPEVLRQFALSAGFGPQLKKKNKEQGCEDIVSTLRSGSAAENAVAIMHEKGFMLQRKSRHRLTPGTVKFAAYHLLALEGEKGLNVIELAEKIQKSGLRDLTTSKTPEASISVALSRDPVLFERIAPSTYCVRPAFRKDPANAEEIISVAREKIQRYVNGFLADTPSDVIKNTDLQNDIGTCSVNGKDNPSVAVDKKNGFDTVGIGGSNPGQEGGEIDESQSGEPWVQGLTEGEYSNLCVEERLNALVAVIGIASEGNTIRAILEDRLDAATALKKQMWAEAQLDRRRMKEENIIKFHDSSFGAAAEGSQSPFTLPDNKVHGPAQAAVVNDASVGLDNAQNQLELLPAEKSLAPQDFSTSSFISSIQPSGYTAERSRMQLKSFIGHKAEEMYVYRSLPLGQDRRRNRYWLFVASGSSHDPGSGRIFVESPDGFWRLIDTEEAFDALLTSLDTRGLRESHLHIMMKKIEIPFRERVRRDTLQNGSVVQCGNATRNEAAEASSGGDSPSSMVCSTSSDRWEPSFKIELGKNEEEKRNALRRYQDFQIWMWKEHFGSSILCALAHGQKRCLPLLGVCDRCLDTFLFEEDFCSSCHRRFANVDFVVKLLESEISYGDIIQFDSENVVISSTSCPLRIILFKALLSMLEVSIPSEAFQSSWTEDTRRIWGLNLHNSSSTEDLLQILTQLEGFVKQDYLSSNFETTKELLRHYASSRAPACQSVSQLPWIPLTTAAVALRLFEFDASVSFDPEPKAEPCNGLKVESFPSPMGYASINDIQKVESTALDRGVHRKEENWNYLGTTPGSSRGKQMARGRGGGGRPRGRLQKGSARSASESTPPVARRGEMLTQALMQQGETQVQKHMRGRRTVRRRRERNLVIEDIHHEYLGDEDNNLRSVAESPESHRGQDDELMDVNMERTPAENDNNSNSGEAMESDDSAQENPYEFGKWDPQFNTSNRSNELMEMSDEDADNTSNDEEEEEDEDDARYRDEDGQNLGSGGDLDMEDNGEDELDRNGDEQGSESDGSGDYSD
nr:homeobox-DDT domain protein RLT1 [Ipomoea batatas]